MTQIIPYLTVSNAAEAIEFYVRAFGAKDMGRMPGPDGKLMHAAIEIEGSPVFLADEFVEWGARGPGLLGGTPVTIHLQTDDAERIFRRAVEAGCEVAMPLELQFWGDLYASLKDPYGHSWGIAQEVERKSPEEALAAMMAGAGA